MNRRDFNRLGVLAGISFAAPLLQAEDFDYPWKLGIITDEVDADLSRTLNTFYPKYGLKWAEIRNVKFDGKSKYVYKSATPSQLKEIKKQLDDAGVKLSDLDTAIYKIALPGTHPHAMEAAEQQPAQGEYERQMEDLKRAADCAHALGTDRLRIFAFLRVENPDSVFDRVVEELNKAIDHAKKNDVSLLLENEFSCNVATGTESARLFKTITDRTLMHLWDPGNCFEAGEEPYPKAWDQLDHSRIGHLHLKDARGKSWEPVGKGEIDFAGQFEALKKMNYSETMSLETHYRNAQKDRYTSSVESMNGLVDVLKKV